ncbi:hypothetical protein pb186bvf_017088 [Paramecium bursaria]
MIYLSFLLFIRVHSIYQLNAIAGQLSFQALSSLFDFEGFQINISGSALGYQIQGGVVQGNQQSLNIYNQTIISTSLSQLNSLAMLSYNKQYQVNVIKVRSSGKITQIQNIFNITSSTCQDIYIGYYYDIIVHCINDGQVILYANKFFQQQQYNTSILLNDTNLKSVNILATGLYKIITINLMYIYTDFAMIYNISFINGILGQPKQIWYQKGQFIQLHVSDDQQIFALTTTYIYSYQYGFVLNYTLKGSTFLTMKIQDYTNKVYLVTNNKILTLDSRLVIQSEIDLQLNIQHAQLFSDFIYLYLLMTNETLIYKIYGSYLFLYQFFHYGLVNDLNVYSQLSNFIVTFDQNNVQIYQLFDYTIYNPSPSQSGMLNLSFYDLNGSLVQQYQLYVNVLTNGSMDIYPTQYQQGNQSLVVYQYQPVILYDLSQLVVGANLLFQIPSNIQGLNLINLKPNQFSENKIQLFLAYPLQTIYGYLTLNVTNTMFQVNVFLLNDIISSEDVWEAQIQTADNITGILMLETIKSELIALLLTDQLILVYYIQPILIVTYQYTINITYLFSLNISINDIIIFENQLLFYNYYIEEYELIIIYVDHYTLKNQNFAMYDYVSILKYGIVNLAFASQQNELYLYIEQAYEWYFVQIFQLPIDLEGFTLYTIPLEQCVILMYTNQTETYLYYFYNDIYKITNIGQQFYYQINVTGLIFNPQQMSFTQKNFYIWVQSQETKINYLYVYSCFDNQINQPYQVLSISSPITYLNAFSSYNKEVDIITYQDNNYTTVYYIPFKPKLILLPVFQLDQVLQYNLSLKILGNQEILKYNLTIIINQTFLNISNTSTQQYNLTQSNYSGQLIMNPYNFFDGAVQNYSIECQTCSSFNYTSIIQNYVYYPKNTLGSCMNNNQLYIQSTNEIFQCDSLSQQYPQQPEEINFTSIYKVQQNGKNEIILTFIEIESQTLSWIYQDGQQIYVYSMINNQTVSMFIANASNIFIVNYQEGFLQLGLNQTYNCYYYIIQNNTQYLKVVAQNISVCETEYANPPFLILEQNENYIIFGSILVDVAESAYGILLNVTLNDIQLQSYNIFNFNQLQFLKNLFPLQSITLLGREVSTQQYFTYINVAYTTLIEAGRMRLTFVGMNLISYRPLCKLNLINSTYSQKFYNLIASYDYQVAVLNTQALTNQTQLILSIFIVDDSVCFDNNLIQPYSFQILNNTGGTASDWNQLVYLTQNLLLLSYDQNTTIYQIQKYLIINYNTSLDSQINISAFNPFNNSYQLINLTIQEDIQVSKTFKWYWIALICVVSIIILAGVILIIYCIKKKQSPDLYQSYKNEIEFK